MQPLSPHLNACLFQGVQQLQMEREIFQQRRYNMIGHRFPQPGTTLCFNPLSFASPTRFILEYASSPSAVVMIVTSTAAFGAEGVTTRSQNVRISEHLSALWARHRKLGRLRSVAKLVHCAAKPGSQRLRLAQEDYLVLKFRFKLVFVQCSTLASPPLELLEPKDQAVVVVFRSSSPAMDKEALTGGGQLTQPPTGKRPVFVMQSSEAGRTLNPLRQTMDASKDSCQTTHVKLEAAVCRSASDCSEYASSTRATCLQKSRSPSSCRHRVIHHHHKGAPI